MAIKKSKTFGRKHELELRMFASRRHLEGILDDKYSKPKTETVAPEEIAEFLHRSAVGHKAFFKYTNVDRLRDLLRTRKLWLSRLSEMNDLMEYTDVKDADRIYIACFSFGSLENMAMWKMYGGDADRSVRLEFRGKDVVDCLGEKGNHKVYYADIEKSELNKDIAENDEIPNEQIEDWSFHDIAYVYGKALVWNRETIGIGRCQKLEDPKGISILETRIKNYGWMNENEVRLVIKLKKTIPGLRRIAVDFEKVVNNLRVKLGPVKSRRTSVEILMRDLGFSVKETTVSDSSYNVDL